MNSGCFCVVLRWAVGRLGECREETHGCDSASSRHSADSARRLAKSVAEHADGGDWRSKMKEKQLQQRAIGERGDWGCDAALCVRANFGSRVCLCL
jgi:hypothetical protein